MNSRQLIRTNPKLSGNVKLTVSSKGVYLDSLDDSILTNSAYKHFPVNLSSNYSSCIRDFFKNTPNDKIFNVSNKSDTTIYDTYDQQFANKYICGASINFDNFYRERFKIFAPIYISKKRIPDSFVVFRIKSEYFNNTGRIANEIKPNTKYLVSGDKFGFVSYLGIRYDYGSEITTEDNTDIEFFDGAKLLDNFT